MDGLIIPAANKQAAGRILDAYRNLYVNNGKLLDPIHNLGEDNFTAEDKYLGRAVAFRIDRFLIAFNGYSDRQKLLDLAVATDARILGSIRKQLVTADKAARRRGPFPGPRLPAGFAHELDRFDHDAFLGALAHVVDREGGDRAGGHRFDLHAGLSFAADDRTDFDGAGCGVDVERDVDGGDRERMRERNQ